MADPYHHPAYVEHHPYVWEIRIDSQAHEGQAWSDVTGFKTLVEGLRSVDAAAHQHPQDSLGRMVYRRIVDRDGHIYYGWYGKQLLIGRV